MLMLPTAHLLDKASSRFKPLEGFGSLIPHGKNNDCNKKMKIFQASAIQSRTSFNVIPFSHLSVRVHNISFSKPRALSVCGFCSIFQLNKDTITGLSFLAMSKACRNAFNSIHHRAAKPLSQRTRYGVGSFRTLLTCSEPLSAPAASLIVHSPSSLVVAACITQSDAPQRSDEWFALRKDKLTTSTFSTALGFWKGSRRFELWHEKVYASEVQIIEASKRSAMEWGVLNEAAAINSYKSITGREVSYMGFATHSSDQFDWLGASPDGLLGCFPVGGILEVKCPYNKGKPEVGLPWSVMPFYYMPQVQGQLEIMDREWADLYCWTPNGSTIIRVHRDRGYWELIQGILREFWWENVMPAREALLLGREEEAQSYKPTPSHKLTRLVIYKSSKLAAESKLLCRELAGHVEFYR